MLFMNIVDNIAKCAVSATSGPEDMMPITLQVFRSITRMIKAISNLLTQAWKIPNPTDLWEAWIGQEFSLLNFTNYISALMTSILPPVPSDKQMDAMFGKPITTGWNHVEIEPFYHGVRRAKDQAAIAAEHTDSVVMMVLIDDTNSGKDLDQNVEKGAEPVKQER
jgi:hypothetical protein